MKALQYTDLGGPEVLSVVEVAEPHPGPGRVRIAVRAAGINPVDSKQRRGLMPAKLPKIPGAEAAGVVDEVGDGVTAVAVGDVVFGAAVGGAAAELAILQAYAVKPAAMSFPEAAAVPVAAETAARVFAILGVSSGQTLLINAASGGVGTLAVQLARARGIAVIGTASQSNHEHLRELGAMPTTYGNGLADRVRAIAPGGVDFAFDAGGRGALPELIAITGSADRVVTIADYAGAQEHGVRFTGGGGEPRAWQALGEAADLYGRGALSVVVARTFSLAEAQEAYRLSEGGHVRGKLVFVLPD